VTQFAELGGNSDGTWWHQRWHLVVFGWHSLPLVKYRVLNYWWHLVALVVALGGG
tara:strand:- start:524 stop:688 length:165 start_codon:yes stop_codon:yes gene_type:complete